MAIGPSSSPRASSFSQDTKALSTSRPAAWRATCSKDFNDRDFDVSLNLVFADKEAHDKYQESDRHKKFIEENLESIEKVRVFDSYLSPAPPAPSSAKAAVGAESPK